MLVEEIVGSVDLSFIDNQWFWFLHIVFNLKIKIMDLYFLHCKKLSCQHSHSAQRSRRRGPQSKIFKKKLTTMFMKIRSELRCALGTPPPLKKVESFKT